MPNMEAIGANGALMSIHARLGGLVEEYLKRVGLILKLYKNSGGGWGKD
jgi:hypothetical protein